MPIADLNSRAQAVILAARKELQCPPGERERLEGLLEARLRAGAPGAGVGFARPLTAHEWRLALPIAVSLGLVAGAAFLSLRPRLTQTPAQTNQGTAVLESSLVRLPTVALNPELPALSTPELEHAVKPTGAPQAVPRAQDRLGQEVALLSRATSDLRAGRAADALKLVDEYQRKFPKGVLGVERSAARAQALCALKRLSEGRAELAQLDPRSPAAGRVKQVCDAAAATADGK